MNDKPEIVLSSRVDKIINWMTEHVDTEVAALGVCEVKNGNLFVEELVFPKQEVTSGSVKFGGSDWKNVIKKVGVSNMSKIQFHWHKHPAGATPSQVDEEETFGTFMDVKTRPLFGFLITGMLGNRIDYDARIMINTPVKATIEAEVTTEEDTEIEEYCKKVLEENVKKEVEVVTTKKSNVVFPYTLDKAGKVMVVFGTIFKKTIQTELKEINDIIKTKQYKEKDGVGIYILTAVGKTKKLRKAIKELVADWEVDDYQKDIKSYEVKDQDFIRYMD